MARQLTEEEKQQQKADVQELVQRARAAMDAIADYDQARVDRAVPGGGLGHGE